MFKSAAVKWVPKTYHRLGVKFLLVHGGAGLLFDPGLGKTATTLEAFRFLLQEGTCRRMLVIAPLRVCYTVWPEEVKKWSNFNHFRVSILHGPHKEEALHEDADIYLINPEGLAWLAEGDRMKRLNPQILCIDESTKFKNMLTQRFGHLRPFLPCFQRRWILTGTPAPNGLLDLYGQVYVLDLGHALGATLSRYRATYFDKEAFDWEIRPGAEEKIYKKVANLVIRMDEKDWLELPELVINDIKVLMPKAARTVYDDMDKKLMAILEDGTRVNAVNMAAAINKCLQIANGSVYVHNTGEARKSKWVHSAKVEALVDLLEQLQGTPALVLYSYEQDKVMLKEALKSGWGDVASVADISAKKSVELFAEWNKGKVPVMLAQAASVSHGLNLQGGGQHLIWFGLPWDLEVYLQAIKRLHRQGSKFKSIFIHALLVEGTLDEAVRNSLSSKDHTQRGFLDAIKAMHKPTKFLK